MWVDAVGVLHEPVRRAVYEFIAGQAEPVSREQVAGAVGIGRTLAAFHLDRLVDAGLLEASYARRNGRTGPGAGRPAKLYRRSAAEYEMSLPPRRYRAVAELLAEVVEDAGEDARLFAAARRRGMAAGSDAAGADLVEVLAEHGYEPRRVASRVVLRNCPFHGVARDYPPLVCGMNLALLQGLVDGLGRKDTVPRLAPEPGHCCVVLDLLSKNNQD